METIGFAALGAICTVFGFFSTRMGKAKEEGSEIAGIKKDIEGLKEDQVSSIEIAELKKDLQYLIQDVKLIRKMLEENNNSNKDRIKRLHVRIDRHERRFHSPDMQVEV